VSDQSAVPTLSELAAASAKAASVPIDAIPAVIGELERVKTILLARLLASQPESQRGDGQWITVEEASHDTSLSLSWIYDHAKELGGRKAGGAVRINRRAFETWKRSRALR
jgi:hypothetical protein